MLFSKKMNKFLKKLIDWEKLLIYTGASESIQTKCIKKYTLTVKIVLSLEYPHAAASAILRP
jgi:hypothetical protein